MSRSSIEEDVMNWTRPVIACALLLAMASVATIAEAQQVPSPTKPAEVPGTPPGTIMTKEYVQLVGRLAYFWGWPLVNNLNRSLAVANLPEPGRLGGVVPASPPGYVSMLTDYIAPDQRFVTCPNQDTVYGAGYQMLDTKPVPDFGERFYTYQIVDARTDSFAAIGKQHETKPGFYLLVGPNWKGDVPKGINAVYRSPTDLAVIFPRVFQDDTPEDKAAVQSLLKRVMVYPLSEFDGAMKTKDWSKSPDFPAPAGQGAGETKWVIPEKFFDQLPQIMKGIPPLPGEEALYGMIQSVLDAAAKDPEIKKTLIETAVDAETSLVQPLFEFHNNGRPIGNGWTSPPNGARWGTDYLSRTATAKSNNVRQRAGGDALHLHGLRFRRSTVEWQQCLYGDIRKGRYAARLGVLVAHALQQAPSLRTQRVQPVLARHKEQVAAIQRRWVTYALFPERVPRRR
jgi:hypothetical protein